MDRDLQFMDKLLWENRGLESYREKAKSENEDWAIEDGLILYKGRLLVPENDDLKVRLVDEAHKQPSTAHPGKAKTMDLIKARYYWPKMDEYVDRYVRNCHIHQKDLPPGLLNPFPIPDRPWQHISMDFRSFPKSKNIFDNVLVVVDRLTKNRYPCLALRISMRGKQPAYFLPTYTAVKEPHWQLCQIEVVSLYRTFGTNSVA